MRTTNRLRWSVLVKSRHSRLSGIILPNNALIRNDSGQAGMTVQRRFSIFYEIIMLALPLLLCACQSIGGKDTIAGLRNMQIEIREEKIEGGLEKAMEGYRRFLEETPDSALSAEAIRRLADLKVEREYGLLSGDTRAEAAPTPSSVSALAKDPAPGESQADFEKRAAQGPVPGTAAAADGLAEGADDLERAGALEAIELYRKLLNDHPMYERNDQVLYQMSRAYEELGRVEEAMGIMNRLVRGPVISMKCSSGAPNISSPAGGTWIARRPTKAS